MLFLACKAAESNGLRTSSHHFRMQIFTEMAVKGGLDKVLDRIIERWAQSSTYMEAFGRRALFSTQFVAQSPSSEQNVKEYTNAIKQNTKQIGSPLLSPNLSSSSSISYTEESPRKHKEEKSIDSDHLWEYTKTH